MTRDQHEMRPIVTTDFGPGWIAHRDDYDLGDHCGMGRTEQAAIDDLLAWETMDETEEDIEEPSSAPAAPTNL